MEWERAMMPFRGERSARVISLNGKKGWEFLYIDSVCTSPQTLSTISLLYSRSIINVCYTLSVPKIEFGTSC